MAAVLAALLAAAVFPHVTRADAPAGYFYGADSGNPTATGSSVFYQEPTVGGTFGGYIAEVDTFTNQLGCTSGRQVNTTDVYDANQNSQRLDGSNYPSGTGLYYFMGGPGSDPNYNASNPSPTEAYNYGYNEAYNAWQYYKNHGPTIVDAIMFMDIENPGNGTYQGWNEEVDKCGNRTWTTSIPYSIDRSTFNGFWDEIYHHTSLFPGVYARQDYWNLTFGTGSYGSVPTTYQWTSQSHSSPERAVSARM